MELFKCSECQIKYPWHMIGGTNKMVVDPVKYSSNKVTKCVYCVGHYPDGTACHQNKDSLRRQL